jgi:hypothetical protein
MKFDIGAFMKICQVTPNSVKNGKKLLGIVHEGISVFYFAGDINSPRKHICATLTSIFTLLSVTGSSTIHREGIVSFPLQKLLRERATLYVHCLYE